MKYEEKAKEILQNQFESLGHNVTGLYSESCTIVDELEYFRAHCKHCKHSVHFNIKNNNTTVFRIDDENGIIAFKKLPYGPEYKICPRLAIME